MCFFHSFHSFFFVFLWLDNFKWPPFDLTFSFFCLIKSDVDALYCNCYFIYYILYLQSFCLILLCDFYHSIKLSLYLCIFSPDFIYLSFFVSCSSLSFLNSTLWNYLSQILTSLGLVTGKFLCSLGGVMFLKGLYSCLHIWRRSHLLQSLLTALVTEIHSMSPASNSEAFSDLYYDTLVPHFLFPFGGKLLILNAFSQSWKSSPGADNLPFAFSVAVINAQVCVLSPSPTDFGSFFARAY